MAATDDERAPVKRPPGYRRHLHRKLACSCWQVHRRRLDALALALLVAALAVETVALWRLALLAVAR